MIGRWRRDRTFHSRQPGYGEALRLGATVCLVLLIFASGCAHSPTPSTPGTFDGTWTTAQVGYDVHVMGPLGTASRPRSAGVQEGDPVFRMISMEGMRFTARQWLADGAWHTVSGELRQDGRLYCTDGRTSWVLERRQ
ncbi:MAG: hypothetical protein ACREIS_11320 [Nitrospiraceae bacterium]